MNQNELDCGNCIHFDGATCVNCQAGNFKGDIINALDCNFFEGCD